MKRDRIGGVFVAVAGLLAGCEAGPGASSMPVLELGEPVRWVESSVSDPLELSGAWHVSVMDDRVYITEGASDRVTVTDRNLALVGRIGREGSGPGELKFPQYVKPAPGGRIGIHEAGNARVSVFDPEGHFVETVARQLPTADAAALGDSLLVVPGVGGPHPAVNAETRDGPRPLAPGPVPPAGKGSALVDQIFVLETAEGPRVVVGRAVAGRFEVFDNDGTLLRTDSLPPDILDEIRSGYDEFERGLNRQGYSLAARRMFKGASLTDDGRLLVLLRMDAPFGILYNPMDGRVERLGTAPGTRAREIMAGAVAADLSGGELFVLSRDNLYVFQLPAGVRR